jgi:uncharacterized protein (TIGR02444 family)
VTLWEFALAAWERPDVRTTCVQLQDEHDQCVALLLWRAWAASEGRSVGAGLMRMAIDLARPWERDVVTPPRTVRRALESPFEGLAESARSRLREETGVSELTAERALLDALESMTPAAVGYRGGLARALTVVIEGWNGARADSLALSLAAALRGELPGREALLI